MFTFSAQVDNPIRRFLIHCLNSRRDRHQLQEAAALVGMGQIDWEAVWDLSTAERVAPLLYHSTRHSDLLPKWLLRRCRAEYVETGALNSLRLRELRAILNELRNHRIDAAALKGVALIDQVYGNPGLRPMLDIDLLIRRDDIHTAVALMEDLGFQRHGLEITPNSTLTYENEIRLSKQGRLDWHLELHWSLFDSPFYQYRLSEVTLWETATTITIEDMPVSILAPEIIVLHLCGHLFLHHRGEGLLWWADVAEVLDHYHEQLDWDVLLTKAQALNLLLPLQVVLPVAVDEWLAPIPTNVIVSLKSLTPTVVEEKIFEAMTAGFQSPARRLVIDVRAIPVWNERLRFIYHNLFPSAAYMDDRYGIKYPMLRFVYYPYRWVRGLAELF